MMGLPDEIVKKFKAMYLIEKARGKAENFLKSLGGRVLKDSAGDGFVNISLCDHEIEVPEADLSKAVFLGNMGYFGPESFDGINKSRLVLACLDGGLSKSEVVDYLDYYGMKIGKALVNTVATQTVLNILDKNMDLPNTRLEFQKVLNQGLDQETRKAIIENPDLSDWIRQNRAELHKLIETT